ncbi:MAG: HXXEE domain-containing protein, partial [Methanobrevibacter sp.]|nr:HXXEE domain-containing protein [Methanobrevibacter sp.]
MLLVIMGIGLFHEWEEKRIPGGFFETVGVVWGWDIDNVDMRKPGRWVVYAWIIIIFIPLIFDNVIGLALAPMFLGVFELLIHSMGRFITKTKRIYFPGIITAWIMGII